MTHFNEHALEMAIMELFEQEGYIYTDGEQVHKEQSDVLLRDDLAMYLRGRYADDDITPLDIETITAKLSADSGGSLYDNNVYTYRLITEGFSIHREDLTKPDLYVQPIDFDNIDNNIFRIVNQLEIKASVSSLACMLGMTLVMGLTPQGGSLTSSWPFCLLMLYFITVLGMRAFKEVRNWRRYPLGTVIIHCAVFLAMAAAFFGSGDKVRARMIVEVGKPVHTALSAPEGRTVVLPFMVTLEEFVVKDSDEGVPQLFLSRVSLTDRKGRVRNVDIKVNHPARVGSWKIYQVGYDRKDLQKSTLECVRDGWYPIIRCSLWIILAAGIWMVFTSGRSDFCRNRRCLPQDFY